jgi:UDP-N-acetylglucosamine--N-acetylmuramyl-(pentapeptide) pyrophosphoryl-undecaprenol N-acetylglucosamine transferase
MQKKKKIIFAVGGTGGHLFPAQALAEELLEKNPQLDILFAGAGLNANRFLDKSRFRFKEVASATPFRRNPLRALFLLLKGIKESFSLFTVEKPDLIIGFGSYHSFPILFSAKWRNIPFVLFEADTIPGKVNRLFSRYAGFTGVHFFSAAEHLKGKSIPVAMPSRHRVALDNITQKQAREFLGLSPQTFTLLIFGGSQGAKGINHQIPLLLSKLKEEPFPIQIVHITGNPEMSSLIKDLCNALNIPYYIKEFEPNMGYVWKAATLAIGRSGASTIAEMIHFEVPGIVIPYPYASDAHQHSNAHFLEQEVKGGICIPEEKATAEALCALIFSCEKKLEYYKQSMRQYKVKAQKETLGKVIYEHFALH